MEPSEFPSNVRKQRDGPARQDREEKKNIERVVSSEVVRRKKPLHRRIFESFVGDNTKGVWGYVLLDVLIPAAKDMVADAVGQGFERMLYGESRSRYRGRSPSGQYGGHVPYNARYAPSSRRDEPRREMSRRSRATHDFDDIILATRVEAEATIDRLHDLIERYDSATVADLYELVGVSGNFTDQKWGWTDIRGSGVSRVRSGYLLDLPRPEPLD